MATAITTYQTQVHSVPSENPGGATQFLHDLITDVRTTPEQMQGAIHTDLFQKHLLKLASCYFALIVLLLSAMVPFLYLVNYNW